MLVPSHGGNEQFVSLTHTEVFGFPALNRLTVLVKLERQLSAVLRAGNAKTADHITATNAALERRTAVQ